MSNALTVRLKPRDTECAAESRRVTLTARLVPALPGGGVPKSSPVDGLMLNHEGGVGELFKLQV